MLASKASHKTSLVWQGSTKDGYALRLTRSVLTQIISKLKQTGLEHLVHSLRSNNQVSLEGAVIRSIAQVVNHANASGTVSSREFGQNLRAFTAIGKTRKYQVLTQPIDRKQSAILFVRSTPIQKVENEYENEYEGEYENEYEDWPPKGPTQRIYLTAKMLKKKGLNPNLLESKQPPPRTSSLPLPTEKPPRTINSLQRQVRRKDSLTRRKARKDLPTIQVTPPSPTGSPPVPARTNKAGKRTQKKRKKPNQT